MDVTIQLHWDTTRAAVVSIWPNSQCLVPSPEVSFPA